MLGYCEALLVGLESVAGINDPQMKNRATGFIQALRTPQNTQNADVLRYDAGSGHRVDVRIRHLQRGKTTDTRTTQSCDPISTPQYIEQTFTLSNYRETAVAVTWDEISRYCKEASNLAPGGRRIEGAPNSPFMQDHLRKVLTMLTGLRQAVNQDSLAAMLPNFGYNANFGSNPAPKPVNLIRAGLDYAKIEEGLQDLMYDFAFNEVSGKPIVVGAGVFHRFNTSIQYGCCNLSGFDFRQMAETAPYDYFADWQTQNIWGTNQFGVFAPGAIQLVTYNRYAGNFTGRHGTSDFGMLPDPYLSYPGGTPWAWDFQLRFEDCGTNARRYTAIVGLTFGLYVPTLNYSAGDPLQNVNGSFRYIGQIKP